MGKSVSLIAQIDEEEAFIERDFKKTLDVDLDNLQTAIARHGGNYYRYGKLHALALREQVRMLNALAVAETEHKALYARLDESVRGDWEEGVKLTEAAVKSKVISSDDYVQSEENLAEMRGNITEFNFTVNILSVAEKVMSKTTEMLKTLGHIVRSEESSDGMHVLSRKEKLIQETARLKQQAREVINPRKRGRS